MLEGRKNGWMDYFVCSGFRSAFIHRESSVGRREPNGLRMCVDAFVVPERSRCCWWSAGSTARALACVPAGGHEVDVFQCGSSCGHIVHQLWYNSRQSSIIIFGLNLVQKMHRWVGCDRVVFRPWGLPFSFCFFCA